MKIFKIVKSSDFRKDLKDLFVKYGLDVKLIIDEGQSDEWAIKQVMKNNEIQLNKENPLPIEDQIGNFRIAISGKVEKYEDNLIKILGLMIEGKPKILLILK